MKYQQCVYRGGDFAADRVICKSDRLIHKGHVDRMFCAERCPYADKPLLKSRGLGDTLHKWLSLTGLSQLAKWKNKGEQAGCGCGSRIEAINKVVPYSADQQE